MFGAMLS